ncbi:hypothetical protein FZEAL_4106 [Fusarium zealandicum]|uniref:Uncharacterized protein n=1 Tax=Fusarium zealandicum TaxID=1053134 RepID=A0A8H4UN77_9HYPO|nr:hypothetical protein FZEAL_4106 [Fusarium zealandicum]
MNSTITTAHSMMQVPPMDARITPPPEELNIVIPKRQTCPALPESPKSMPDTPQSGFVSASSPSTRKRQRRRSSSSRCRPPKVDVKQQPYSNSNIIFSPRPYENLYVERAYLAGGLQQQSVRAADLIRQYSAVDLQLLNLGGATGQRRLRKQLGLLKSKIHEAVEQEKAIFVRLGELYVEIQSRETWAQTGYQHGWAIDSPSVETPSVYDPMSAMFYGLPTPTTPLNAACADFVPMCYFGGLQQIADPSLYQHEPVDTGYGLDTVEEAGEDILYGPDSGCESVESETTPATPVAADAPVAATDECGMGVGEAFEDDRVMAIRERRFSLPCLQTAWPEA